MKIKLSKNQWELIGKTASWNGGENEDLINDLTYEEYMECMRNLKTLIREEEINLDLHKNQLRKMIIMDQKWFCLILNQFYHLIFQT